VSRKIINVGSAPLAGDGEQLRDALIKVNDNFEEIYVAVENIVIPDVSELATEQYVDDAISAIVIPDVSNFITAADIPTDFKGSVFADDSTLLVDAVNASIPYSVLSGAPTALSSFANDLDYAAIVGTTIQNNGLPVNTTLTGDLLAQSNSIVNANLVGATGDFKGSIFADDSGVLVDGISGTIPGTLTGSWNSPGNSFNITGEGLSVSTQNTALAISNNGLNFANSLNDETTSISISSSNVSLSTTGIVGITGVSLSVSTENTALTISNNGLNFANSLNDESTAISISSGNINLSTTGGISVAAPGGITIASGPIAAAVNGTTTLSNADNVSWAVNGDFSVAANNININSGGIFANTFTGDVRGSVFADDSTLLVDGVNGKIVGEIDTLAGSIINLDSANFVVENIFAGNQFGVNIGAGGFNNLVVLEGEVRIQNVPLKVNSNGLTFPDNTIQTTAYQITKEITHSTDTLVVGSNFGDGSNISITNNHQTEKVLITNNLADNGRATLPNVSVYGKIVILVTSSVSGTFVDTNIWNGDTTSTFVANTSDTVGVFISLGAAGWKLI
jgi:inosine/xanthosine triphosphate pyrophosphatase family protein